MTDTEGTTTEKTTYEVPTVAKVSEMINNIFSNIQQYTIAPLTVSDTEIGFGPYVVLTGGGSIQRKYTIPEKYKVKLFLIQSSIYKPEINIKLDNGDIFEVNYEFNDSDLEYNSMIGKYTGYITIDLSNFTAYPITECSYASLLYYREYILELPLNKFHSLTSIEYNYKYAIDKLTPFTHSGYLFGKYAYSTKSNYDETKASYKITDDHTIYLKFLQDNTNQPVVRIRTGDTVLYIIDYQLSSELKEVNYYFPDSSVGSKAYQGEAYIDLSSIIVYTNDESEIKLSVIQNGEFQDVVALPKKKLVASISKPDDNTILTFGNFRDLIYPPGSIFISTNNINPETFIGGTWETITGIISTGYSWVRLLS